MAQKSGAAKIGKLTQRESGELVLRLNAGTARSLERLEASHSGDFAVLAKAAGLDPKRDFIGADLSNLPLGASKSNLRGFNFSRADLRGTNLRDANIDATTIVEGAKLDDGDRRFVRRLRSLARNAPRSHGKFNYDEVHAMIRRGEEPPRAWRPWIRSLDFTGERVLTDLTPLTCLAELHTVNLGDTSVSDLAPLARLPALQSVEFWRTNVSDLSALEGLTSLRSVDFMDTKVRDLAPLKGLTGLQRIALSYAAVSDLTPLAGLTALEFVDVTHTPVSDLAPLRGLPNLVSIFVETADRAQALTKTLGKAGIVRVADYMRPIPETASRQSP